MRVKGVLRTSNPDDNREENCRNKVDLICFKPKNSRKNCKNPSLALESSGYKRIIY